jgi:hypothetical protein
VLPPYGRLADLPAEILEAPALRQRCKIGSIMVRISTQSGLAKAPGVAASKVEIRRSAGDRKGKH